MTKVYATSTTALVLAGDSVPAVKTDKPRYRRYLSAKALRRAAEAPVIPGIQLQVLFETGQDELTERGRASILLLAELLQAYPQLLVRLEGHTDSRGTDEYNNVLSDYRARSVEDCLIAAGIEAARIERSACGNSRSRATRDDIRGQALERRVTIEVYRASREQLLAGGSDRRLAPVH